MPTLVHTGLQLPHQRLTVTALDQQATPHGVAYTATLCLDDTDIGIVENNGNGGATRFRPRGVVPPVGPGPVRRLLDDFAGRCRLGGGRVDTERVLVALVDEFDLTRQVAGAVAAGGTLARAVTDDGYTVDTIALTDPVHGGTVRQSVAETLNARRGRWDDQRWQVWDGQAWQALPASRPTPA